MSRVFCSLYDFFSFLPFGQAAFYERSSLRASWVFSIHEVVLPDYRPPLPSLGGKLGKDLYAVT